MCVCVILILKSICVEFNDLHKVVITLPSFSGHITMLLCVCVILILKSICVEFNDLHKVVITLSYFTEIQSFIYHWIPC